MPRADFVHAITIPALELPSWSRLLLSRAADDDFCRVEVLARDLGAGEPAQHRQLADVRQRVGDRALEQSLRLACERLIRREVVVEPLQRVVEAGDLCVPLERRRVVPRLLAL